MSVLEVELPDNVIADEAKLALALALFQEAKLSLGQAAKMAGCSKRGFMEIAGRPGVPVFAYPAEDLARELLV